MLRRRKITYSTPQCDIIRIDYRVAICQLSGVGTEDTDDIDLDDLLLP